MIVPFDALDPGPNGDFPWFPRDSQGHPFWSDRAETDGNPVDEHGVSMPWAPMSRGVRINGGVRIDLTPTITLPGVGVVVVDPPTIPPEGLG